MDYNYHTHTWRCSHATGEEEEYIKRAIKYGIKYMGFSEHAPFVFPDGYESGYRVQMTRAQEYIDTISQLRQKYKDQIDIKIGFEMEYYPKYFDEMFRVATDFGAEFLILGQHFLGNEHPGGMYVIGVPPSLEYIREYTSCVVEGMASGRFSYVAHPDIFPNKGLKRIYEEEMRKICIASRLFDVPLEINFLGIRQGRHYPVEDFWKIAGEELSPVTFGFDAHDVLSAYDGESLKIAKQMVKNYNLNYIGKPNIISIQGEN